MRADAIPCPACGVRSGEWCRRHGATQPGPLLACVARVRAADAVARGLRAALESDGVRKVVES